MKKYIGFGSVGLILVVLMLLLNLIGFDMFGSGLVNVALVLAVLGIIKDRGLSRYIAIAIIVLQLTIIIYGFFSGAFFKIL